MTIDLRLTRPEEVDATNPVAGDLHVVGPDFATVTGADAIAQEAEVTLRWFRGEWFLDLSAGVPYFGEVLRKGATEASVRAVLRAAILRVPDVRRVERLDVRIDRRLRTLEVEADIVTAEGAATVATTAGV